MRRKVEQGPRVRIEVLRCDFEAAEFVYRCKACGHEWSDTVKDPTGRKIGVAGCRLMLRYWTKPSPDGKVPTIQGTCPRCTRAWRDERKRVREERLWPPRPTCHVVNEGCECPANLIYLARPKIPSCYACGNPVCKACSRLVIDYNGKRIRVCARCREDDPERFTEPGGSRG